MPINKQKNIETLKQVAAVKHKKTLMHALGIELTEISEDRVCGTMPVDERTIQYYEMLHGGASVAFAETLCSCAACIHIDMDHQKVVGLEINANHIRGMSSGILYGEAKPYHIGKRTQVWSIEIKNEKQELVCISRCTMAVVELSR